jgi:hypothetical protein
VTLLAALQLGEHRRHSLESWRSLQDLAARLHAPNRTSAQLFDHRLHHRRTYAIADHFDLVPSSPMFEAVCAWKSHRAPLLYRLAAAPKGEDFFATIYSRLS